MVVTLFLMVTSSFEFIRWTIYLWLCVYVDVCACVCIKYWYKCHFNTRRSFFEVFWYTHHLFVIFMLALAFHQYQWVNQLSTYTHRCTQACYIAGLCTINRINVYDDSVVRYYYKFYIVMNVHLRDLWCPNKFYKCSDCVHPNSW